MPQRQQVQEVQVVGCDFLEETRGKATQAIISLAKKKSRAPSPHDVLSAINLKKSCFGIASPKSIDLSG